ncbi:MAG: Ig-like domain-containing protein [Rhizobiaceae bacterium]
MSITTVTDLGDFTNSYTIHSMSITGVAFDAPGVTISGVPANVHDVTPFNITMQFTETVTGFTLADIAVGNGVASNFVAVDGDTYTATITPTSATDDVTVTIAAGAAQDLAGLNNAAASTNGTMAEDTHKVIATFMLNRANHILSNQADISGLFPETILAVVIHWAGFNRTAMRAARRFHL